MATLLAADLSIKRPLAFVVVCEQLLRESNRRMVISIRQTRYRLRRTGIPYAEHSGARLL
jgi:hypothetical protein